MTTLHVLSMRLRITGIASCALLLAGVAAPGMSYAEDGRQAQSITLAPIASIFVGQFTEVRATASSGLPVSLTVEGDCQLRQMPGAANDIVVATQAGDCTVTANQAGDPNWAPAPSVQRTFSLIASEADVLVTIPGPDRIDPGQPLRVFADVTGENGDDPTPNGTVDVTVRGISGDPVQKATVALDAHGEAALDVPASTTASWPIGVYHVEAAYSGDPGYLAADAVPIAFRVGDVGVRETEPCYWRDDDGSTTPPPGEKAPGGLANSGRDDNGLTLSVTPPVAAQGWDKTTAQITGWETGVRDVFVTWSVGYGAVPEVTSGSMQNGRVELAIDTERAQRSTVPVDASYSFRVKKWFCSGTLSDTLKVTPRYQGTLRLEPPYRYSNTVRKPYIQGDGRKNPAIYPSATFRVATENHVEPMMSTKSSESGCKLSRNGESDTWYEYYVVAKGWCRVYMSIPATRQYRAPSPITFTLIGTCGINKNPCEGLPPNESPGPQNSDPAEPVSGSTAVLDETPSGTRADPSEVNVKAGDAVHLRVPWSPIGDELTVSVLDNGRWVLLGRAEVGADGYASLPTFAASDPGEYLMRIMDNSTGYVMVCVE